jgi:hypothetical protein
MLKRFLAVIALGMVLEVGAFAYVNRDALALMTDWPLWSNGTDAFETRASRLLGQAKVPRQGAETIATQARARGLTSLEARALGVLSRQNPGDEVLALRYADALRRAGNLEEAERVYSSLLDDTTKEAR